MSNNLNPQKALIFRIVHIRNVPWILEHGGLSREPQRSRIRIM